MKLLLASGSPRRYQLLTTCGIVVSEVRPPHIVEQRQPSESPLQYCQRLAYEKAHAINAPEHCILAADTIVCLEEQIFEKPTDNAHAQQILTLLSNRWHSVHTAWYLRGRKHVGGLSTSRVKFRKLSAPEINSYIQTGEGKDKAGSYGIQGLGAALIDSIEGCYSTIVGLPVSEVLQALAKEDIYPQYGDKQ